MKLVIGLGNPGPRYEQTRHNLGFRIAEQLAMRHGIALSTRRFGGAYGRGSLRRADGDAPIEVSILEPHTFMNRSGESVAAALEALPSVEVARDLIVCFDDVDLPFGRLRLRPGGSAGGHRGVADIISRVGHTGFARLRFGVGRPTEAEGTAEHVLEEFSQRETAALPALVERATDAVETTFLSGITRAMNLYNREPDGEDG